MFTPKTEVSSFKLIEYYDFFFVILLNEKPTLVKVLRRNLIVCKWLGMIHSLWTIPDPYVSVLDRMSAYLQGRSVNFLVYCTIGEFYSDIFYIYTVIYYIYIIYVP